MTEWEYMSDQFLFTSRDMIVQYLDKLGAKGWELTCSFPNQEYLVFIFKRTKLSFKPEY